MDRQVSEAGTAAERLRCEALERHAARVAGRNRLVQRLREMYLGDKTVSKKEAIRLLWSPATLYLRPSFWDDGICFVGHRATVLSEKTEATDHETYRDVIVQVGQHKAKARHTLASADGMNLPRRVFLPAPDGREAPCQVFPGSTLAIMLAWLDGIISGCKWTEAEAVMFAFTGEVPRIEPVTAHLEVAEAVDRTPLRGELVLRIQSHVRLSTALRAVEKLRKQLILRQGKLRIGPPLSERSIALFDFVEDRRTSTGELSPWPEVAAEWNRTVRKAWRYAPEQRTHLKRDYERVRRVLVDRLRPSQRERAAAPYRITATGFVENVIREAVAPPRRQHTVRRRTVRKRR